MTKACCVPALILTLGLVLPCVVLAQEDAPLAYQASDTEFQWVTSGSDITQITTGLRYTHHNWYGEASIGGLSAFDNRENAFFLGLNLGRRFQLIPRLYLGADVGYRHVIPDGSDDPAIDTDKFFTLEARLKLEIVLGKHLSAFIGVAATNIYQGYSLGSDTVGKESIFFGVGLL
ncbi:MAG: hypothetical protein KAH56_01575 [Candidatus Krumholzibacteria bacterium]|nr:hypothetical protein [Candidatus Krumholzibacteria bacterium]